MIEKENTKNKLIRILSSPYIINLGVVLFITGIVWSLNSIWPFGTMSIAKQDLRLQYLGFYDYLNHVLRGQDGFMYSMYKGMGGGMFPLWTYYLMSPFNLVYLIFNGENILYGVQIVYLLKILSMTLTVTYYLTKKETNKGLNLILTLGWVFSSYMLITRVHLMWVDAFILLPLLTLALEDGLKTGKYIRYTIYLTLTIWSNYYIGYMVGLFTLIYVLYQYLIKEKDDKLYFWGYVRNCLYSGIMSLWVLLPTAYTILKSVGSAGSSSLTHTIDISHSIVMSRFIDVSQVTYSQGPPALMMGTVILVMTLIVWRYAERKEQRAFIIIAFIYVLSFLFRPISRIWTFGQDEHGFLHRYTFGYIWFIVIFITQNRAGLNNQLSVKFKGIITIVIMVPCILVFTSTNLSFREIGIPITIFSVIALIITYLPAKHRQPFYLLIHVVELIVIISWFNIFSTLMNIENYRTTYTDFKQDIVSQIKPTNGGRVNLLDYEPFYNHAFSYLQPMVPHTSSATSNEERQLMIDVGMTGTYSTIGHQGMTDISASLLNVQYIDTQFVKKDIPYYLDTAQFTPLTETLYENNVRLGFGYTIDTIEQNKEEISYQDKIDKITRTLLGKVYTTKIEPTIIREGNIVIEEEANKKIIKVCDDTKSSLIGYKIPENVNYLYHMDISTIEYTQVNETDKQIIEDQKHRSSQLIKIPDNVTELVFKLYYSEEDPRNRQWYYEPEFYEIDNETLIEDLANYFDRHTSLEDVEINQRKSTITGTMDNIYQQPYLQFNLPYDSGWKAKINGQIVEPINSLNLLTLPIPDGQSSIEIHYETQYLKMSVIISIVGLVLLVLDNKYTINKKHHIE